MKRFEQWGMQLLAAFDELAAATLSALPKLLGALLLLLVGWLLARTLRAATRRLIDGLERMLRRFSSTVVDENYARINSSSARVLSTLVFWIVMLVFVALASSVFEFQLFRAWVDAFVAYLPTLFAGIAIIFAGIVVGGIARGMVTQAALAANLTRSELAGRVAQVAVLAAAAVIGAGQLGIDVTFLISLSTVAVAAIVGAMALGVALGTPVHVNNYLSAHFVRRVYREGDLVQIGDFAGRVTAISSQAVMLETDDGEVCVPARLFMDRPSTKLIGDEDAPGSHE